MEADSTTFENCSDKLSADENYLPFTTFPENLKLYKELVSNSVGRSFESQLIEKIQHIGLLPSSIKCPTDKPDCKVICKQARVIDRVQWVCEGCGKRQSIRKGTFFNRMQCSILQALQLILAWCEDADLNIAVQHFDIRPKVVNAVMEKLDDMAIRELRINKLGGENAVVLAEMYPSCLNRLSPDTTEQSHSHRILMFADTKHIPTEYRLHVIRDGGRHVGHSDDSEFIRTQIEEVRANLIEPNSMLVMGTNVPTMEGAVSLQQLQQHCDRDMQHFLSTRIWRQAIALCSASRDLCAANAPALCTALVQRYLDTALYRGWRAGDGFYERTLRLISEKFAYDDSVC